ncbi:MAG: hypothetical protein U0746_06630 [Gemmataceae bacterium]
MTPRDHRAADQDAPLASSGRGVTVLIWFLVLGSWFLQGCNRREITAPPTKTPNDNLTGQQRVAQAMPVLGRAISQNDLNQLKAFIVNAQAETGKYARSLADLPGIERDAPNLAAFIKDGDIVLAGGKGGVLAYDKRALEDRGMVATTAGVQTMTKDELERALSGS